MNYLVHPQDLVFRAKSRIAGFNEMIAQEEVPQWDLLDVATDIAGEWTNDWDEDQGFGSSDGTYMLKEFIDGVINSFTNGTYKTDFTPSLTVIKQ